MSLCYTEDNSGKFILNGRAVTLVAELRTFCHFLRLPD